MRTSVHGSDPSLKIIHWRRVYTGSFNWPPLKVGTILLAYLNEVENDYI